MRSGETGPMVQVFHRMDFTLAEEFCIGGIRSNWRIMTSTKRLLLATAFCCLMGAPSMFGTWFNASGGGELFNGSETLVGGTKPATCPTATSVGINGGSGIGQDTITDIE